jgi:hypothetical protein
MAEKSRLELSQESLKLIACLSMLLDHIGATLVHQQWLRIVGRLAFPIYCFLLVEGAYRTRDRGHYALRLAVAAILSELPFDLALFGGITWQHQNVMVTLLLGLGAIACLDKLKSGFSKAAAFLGICIAAELLCTDYGAMGICVIGLFALTRNNPRKVPLQTVGLFLLCLFSGSLQVSFFGLYIPIEIYAMLSLPLIYCYHGKKHTYKKAVQWAFYLFYPIHLAVLLLICLF